MTHTAGQPDDAAMRDAALMWQVTFWSGEVTADERRAFARWLDERPEHHAAWQQVQQTEHWLRSLPGPAAGQALRAPAPRLSRRKALGLLGAMAGTGLVAYAGHDTPLWHRTMAGHATGRGERRTVMLADGTRVVLNSASALDVQFDAHQRRRNLDRHGRRPRRPPLSGGHRAGHDPGAGHPVHGAAGRRPCAGEPV